MLLNVDFTLHFVACVDNYVTTSPQCCIMNVTSGIVVASVVTEVAAAAELTEMSLYIQFKQYVGWMQGAERCVLSLKGVNSSSVVAVSADCRHSSLCILE